MAQTRGYAAGKYGLTIGSDFAGYITKVDVGAMEAEIQTTNGGPMLRQKKSQTKFKFAPISFDFGLSHANELLKWIQSSYDMNHRQMDGEIIIFDVRMKPMRTIQFFGAHLLEFKMEALDAKSAKNGLKASCKIQPEDVKIAENGSSVNPIIGTNQKLMIGTNYRFECPGLDTQFVTKVEIPGFEVKIAEHAVGLHNRSQYEACSMDIKDLKFTISAHEAEKLHKDAIKWMADGVRSEEGERTCTLDILAPDAKEVTVSFTFLNCGYKKVVMHNPSDAGKDDIATSSVEMYCEETKMQILKANM